MRRSLFAGIGALAVLIFAACSPDQSSDRPLAPTEPLLAPGGASTLCSGNAASNIAKNEKVLFVDPGLGDLQDQFALIKAACPIDETNADELALLLGYFQLMIDNRTPENSAGLAAHLNNVAAYAREAGSLGVPDSVFSDLGGADVLTVTDDAGDALVSFDKGARLAFGAGTDAITTAGTEPFGSRLFTFTPLTAEECGDLTGLRTATRGAGAPCYDILDYPHADEYRDAATLTICMKKSADENYGIVHENKKNSFGDEVLPDISLTYDCSFFHAAVPAGWLQKNGGPLGRVLARAYDYFAPKALIADDAGESGSLGFFSKVGGVLNDTFEDDFNDSLVFNPNPAADRPDLGDTTWIYNAPTPGFIRMQSSLGNLGLVTPGVLVLSQGQGACDHCPVFKLLGEVKTVDEDINQTNEADRETNGSFEISWKELQSKPSVKEAPFVLLNNALNNNNNNLSNVEIARISHVTVSSQNKLLIKVLTDEGCPVPGPNPCVRTIDAGTWTQNESDEFKIILNLATVNPDSAKRVAFFVNGVEKANVKAWNATGFKHLGYVLAGIDAGIIGSDDWFVTRRSDKPKP